MQRSQRFSVCPLCEAGCGLAFEVDANKNARDRIVEVGPNHQDAISKGFICPKGTEILNLEKDPDRLREPMRKGKDGKFYPIAWSDAFDIVASRLNEIRRKYGSDAIATYFGTVFVHKYGALLLRTPLLRALGTKNSTSAGSQDTSARFAALRFMFGSTTSIPVPDIDRCQYFLCIGANPIVSNGSMMTAPNMRGRIRELIRRSGKVVVVDPRCSETAKVASEHLAIRPGTDAAFLLAMIRVLVKQDRIDLRWMEQETRGWSEVCSYLDDFSPQNVERYTGIQAKTIERIAFEFVNAPSSVAYSRMGPGTARHATLTCYAVELLNIVAGRLGKVGGAMFPSPAIDLHRLVQLAGADTFDSFRSRIRGLPETMGDVPATTLAEEMETPGPGQIKALLTFAGNPVLSVPNGRRLEAAIEKLEFRMAVDIYINETTRHADIILPPANSMSEDHVDIFFANMAVRNGIRWSAPVLEHLENDQFLDWQILEQLTRRLGGGVLGLPAIDRILEILHIKVSPAMIAELMLRTGPYGDWFMPWLLKNGLNRKRLQRIPHGVDLGALQPGYRHRIYTKDKRINLVEEPILTAMDQLKEEIGQQQRSDRGNEQVLNHDDDSKSDSMFNLRLIGRRELRSNNSWMHNLPRLMAGNHRCVLFVHPHDAYPCGVKDGDRVVLESRVHRGEVPILITEAIRPGVVSLPHGYGHSRLRPWQGVAPEYAGVSANDWTDDQEVESIVGQSILNGVPVRIQVLHDS